MKRIYISKEDILEIYKDGDKYILKYPTFNVTMPEVVKEIPKSAVDSYLAGEHTGEELIRFANSGYWELRTDQWHADQKFLREHPKYILFDLENNRQYFSEEEFDALLKKAREHSDED